MYPPVIQLETRRLELESELRLLRSVHAAHVASLRPPRTRLLSLVLAFRSSSDSQCVECS